MLTFPTLPLLVPRFTDQVFSDLPFDLLSIRDPAIASSPVELPQLRTSEDGSNYLATLTAPGVRTEDLNVRVEGQTLRIEGETKTANQHMRIARSLWFPADANVQSLIASHADGVLTVTVPKQSPTPVQLQLSAPTDRDENKYHFAIEAPGVRPADMKVTRLGQRLDIEGETKSAARHMQIRRSLQLPPDADVRGMSVSLSDGLLSVDAPKYVAQSMPQQIKLVPGQQATIAS